MYVNVYVYVYVYVCNTPFKINQMTKKHFPFRKYVARSVCQIPVL